MNGGQGCPKCVIDGGRLAGAAKALATQAHANAKADDAAMRGGKLTTDQQERLRALSEYDCKLAAFIEERTAYIRLARVGTDGNGEAGLYGGEYEGLFVIDVATGIKRK